MSRLPELSNERIVRALVKAGFRVREGAKHTVVESAEGFTTIPRHRVVKRTTLARILKDLGMSPEEFGKLL